MKYRKIDRTWFIVLASGEPIIAKLTEFVRAEHIRAGAFQAIGAVSQAELAHYNPEGKKYQTMVLTEPLEIVSLLGDISYHNDDIVVHAHIAVGNDRMECFGGHLKEATVSATCEVVFQELPTTLKRKPDSKIGLNLIDLS